jgi:hypothetical protein
MDAGGGKWLRVDALAEDQAFRLLEGLETQHPRVLKEAA